MVLFLLIGNLNNAPDEEAAKQLVWGDRKNTGFAWKNEENVCFKLEDARIVSKQRWTRSYDFFRESKNEDF